MKTQTKLAAFALISVVALSGLAMFMIIRDTEGPFIYEIDIMPVSPKAGDTLTVTIYCVDASGVSSARLSLSTDGLNWVEENMTFYACLCLAGGRWIANFGPVSGGETIHFYATAYDNSAAHNAADTQVFEFDIQ